ncbi:MAG: hypothetical protein QG549_239 [Patescibacteria group bacterium]|nr:hypothetical protein [Patescibacteria group bacterium]
MVEGARLESVYGSNVIAGSNPVLSAKNKDQTFVWSLFLRTGFEPALLQSKSRKVRCSECSKEKHEVFF